MDLQQYEDKLRKLFDAGRLSAEQVVDRVDAISKVWREIQGTESIKEDFEREALRKYEEARAGIIGLKDEVGENAKTSMRQHINGLGMDKEKALLDNRNALELNEAQADGLHDADKWLLTACMKEDGSMENSIVFRLLSRPESERLFAYSLIEQGYPKEVAASDILLFHRRNYRPNLKQIVKNGFDEAALTRVYQQTCQAGKVMQSMQDVNQKEAGTKELKEKKDNIFKSLEALQEIQNTYNEAGWFRRLRLKSKVEDAIKGVCTAVEAFLETTVEIPGEGETKVMDYVKNSIMTATGAKLAGGGLGVAFGAAKDVVSWAQAASSQTTMAANIFGSLLGGFNLVVAVAGILKTYKGFTKLSRLTQAGLVMDWANQLVISPGSAISSSITGAMYAAGAAGQTATAATAIVGIVAGGVATGIGGYKLATAVAEGRKGAHAREELNETYRKMWEPIRTGDATMDYILEKPWHETKEDKQQNRFENDIFNIQERIKSREKASAGCLVAGGLCTMAASACLLTQNYVLATLFGAAGFGIALYSMISSRKKKKEDQTKAIDDYLHTDKLAEKRFREIRDKTGKDPGEKEQKKIRDQLRKEMMALYGYSSEKAMFLDIMQTYASYIRQKLDIAKNFITGGNISEAKPFIDLVESLGLKYDQSEGLPTTDMIFQKLTS